MFHCIKDCVSVVLLSTPDYTALCETEHQTAYNTDLSVIIIINN